MAYPVNTWSFSVNSAELALAMRTWTLTHAADANGHNLASQSKAGFMSPVDKAKLDSLGGGAGDIENGSINTIHLADGAVATAKIAIGVTITGTLVGNADTATQAVNDGYGNNIVDTYATKLSLGSYVLGTTYESGLALKANKAEVESALEGKQPVGSYATTKQLEDGLATKQAVGNYATVPQLNTGLAEKQPKGDYVLVSTHASDLAGKQDKGDYVTTSTLTTELAKKQNAGNYATTAQLAEKQDKGDYATTKDLTDGLATKQAAGDYATKSELNSGLAGKQAVGDYATRTELSNAIAGVTIGDGSITVNKLANTIDLGGLS